MTKACTDEKDLYNDVRFCRGQKSLPGIRAYAFFIKRSNILTWPQRQDGEDLAAIATLKGDFTLAADKKWNRLDLIPDENELQSEPAGSWGSKYFNNTLTIVVPGTNEKVTGLAAELIGDDTVFLISQRNGKFRLLGNEDFVAIAEPTINLGKSKDDAAALTVKITIDDELPAPFYPGKIETNDGDISGATGKAIVADTTKGS